MNANTFNSPALLGEALLGENDPAPVEIHNRRGGSRILFTCEHAGRSIPARLGDLGLSDEDRERHIAWDIGAADTARLLADLIDAPLVLQAYSRLVVDCNRPRTAPDAIPIHSDGSDIEGNKELSNLEKSLRFDQIHLPFHDTVADLLDAKVARQEPPAIVAFHTFTPVFAGERRTVDVGILYNRDGRMAHVFEQCLGEIRGDLAIAHNEPYSVDDVTDFTIPHHGEGRGIPHVLLEIRNDHLETERQRGEWSLMLKQAFDMTLMRL